MVSLGYQLSHNVYEKLLKIIQVVIRNIATSRILFSVNLSEQADKMQIHLEEFYIPEFESILSEVEDELGQIDFNYLRVLILFFYLFRIIAFINIFFQLAQWSLS
jgi:hypothetical protein